MPRHHSRASGGGTSTKIRPLHALNPPFRGSMSSLEWTQARADGERCQKAGPSPEGMERLLMATAFRGPALGYGGGWCREGSGPVGRPPCDHPCRHRPPSQDPHGRHRAQHEETEKIVVIGICFWMRALAAGRESCDGGRGPACRHLLRKALRGTITSGRHAASQMRDSFSLTVPGIQPFGGTCARRASGRAWGRVTWIASASCR